MIPVVTLPLCQKLLIKSNIKRSKKTTLQKMNNLFLPYESSIEQYFAAHIVQGYQQYCSTLLHSTTCSVLLTTLNNVSSKTLFNAVFIRQE